MPTQDLSATITTIINNIESLVPAYMVIEEDRNNAKGSLAVCIIDSSGNIYGRIFGDDKILGRERYRVAWTKASQVWITGIKTGEFEKLALPYRKVSAKPPDKAPDQMYGAGLCGILLS